jgi:toxin ParE1/3/4
VKRYILTKAATADLIQIAEYIAADNPKAADRMIGLIEKRCDSVVDFPDRGTDRSQWGAGLRSVNVGNYYVFYRHVNASIEIARIIHSARNIDAIFNPNE